MARRPPMTGVRLSAPGAWLAVTLVVGCSSSRPAGATPTAATPDGSTKDAGATPGDGGAGAGPIDAGSGAGPADSAPNTATDDRSAPSSSDAGEASDGPAEGSGPPPRCSPRHAWSTPQSVPIAPATGFARFGGVAANELTIAWTSTDGAVHVADRTSTAFTYDPSTVLDPAPAQLAADRVALDATGRTVIGVVADRSTLTGFNRAAPGFAWTELPASQFSNIAAMIVENGGALSEPVLGADGASLFFLITPTGGVPLLAESTWDARSRAWTTGSGFTNPELASADAARRRRPTGASADGRTLFFFDEIAASERAAWRAVPGGSFMQFVDLPGFDDAAPDGQCDKLYYAEPADGGAPGVATAQ